ncbi:MAG: cadmium-translocating P-type ATPase [Oscillospiraceae bacterium]|nr:cadmium-translocating P-type ATPase [Oscillospiraceae bacterium]
MSEKQKKLLLRIAVSIVLFAAAFAVQKLTDLSKVFYLLMYLVPYFAAGYDVLIKSVKNIAHGQLFDENFLMSLATAGALIIGEYPESVFVMLFYQTGELFQSIAVEKSRRSISALMDIAPVSARVLRDGEEIEIDPEEVTEGDTLIIRPGEKVPVDALVLDGFSSLDTSALTGESAPLDVTPGSKLISGCVNLTGALRCKALCEYENSSVAKILELVENSSMNKAKSESFITKFAKYYTPAVVLAAALIAFIPSVITKNPAEWVYRALIFLVVSCPCAVVISVPLAYFAGIGGASSKGLLIKGGNYLEALSSIKTAVFDKTGTLTTGRFAVTEIIPAEGLSEQRLLALAAGAEYYSNHPLACAIRKAAENIKLTAPDSVTEIAGQGIEAVFGGNRVLAGNALLLRNGGIDFAARKDDATFVYIAAGDKYAGAIRLEDTVKDGARDTVFALKKAGIKKTVMLTGDRRASAQKIADEAGIDEIHHSLLPGDKVARLSDILAKRGKREKLFFVGDGINDAPVLSLADVGIAMGALGSDAAVEAADVVIMDDDIKKLVTLIKTAKKTHRVVTENVAFALGVKLAVLILAAMGLTNMWVGVLADVGVSVLCILNSMRMLIKEHR